MQARTLFWTFVATAITVGLMAAPASAIVGGSLAPSTPFMMQVFDVRSAVGDVFQCGGTLVAKSWVLTAQHCLADEGETTAVRVGTTTLGGGTRIAVDRFVTPPTVGDVALLHLVSEVDATPVRLGATAPPISSSGAVYGWGAERATTPGEKTVMSPVLKQTSTEVQSEITDVYGGPGFLTRSVNGVGAAYLGDSGGPLIVDGVQVGVASKAVGGASPSASTIFASTRSYRAWIESVTTATDEVPTGNLALNGLATSQNHSCTSDQTAKKVVDGRVGTPEDGWCAIGGDFRDLQVDLGSTQALKRIVLKHAGAGGESPALNTSEFFLYTSTDGESWRFVDAVSNNTASITTSHLNVPARYIKFVSFDEVVKLYELEAYAT